jgi:hypothetical protein
MLAFPFFQAVVHDENDFLTEFFEVLERLHIGYCVIGRLGVNAYADPVISLDVDVAVAGADLARLCKAVEAKYSVKQHLHSLNIEKKGSDLRIQVQTDPRYSEFAGRAQEREVLGRKMKVAALDDLLQGKIWAVQDKDRKPSKRQKDLADIARLLERYPEKMAQVPQEIISRLEQK